MRGSELSMPELSRRVGTFTYEYLFASDEPVEIEWGDAMFNVDGKQFPCSPYDDK